MAMDQETTEVQKPRVMRLNNDYTNSQLKDQAASVATPKRRYLGLILVTVVVVLTLPAYGLISSFHSLKEAQVTNTKTVQQSSQVQYQASSEAQMVKNMQNSYYIQKYARSEFHYALPGEKIFTVPSSVGKDSDAATVVAGGD
jgi:cell division protein FtsB